MAKLLNSEKVTDPAEQHFVTSIASLACHAAVGQPLSELHELLEAYYRGPVDPGRITSVLLDPVGVPFGVLSGNLTPEALAIGITQVLASKTVREFVVDAVETLRRDGTVDASLPMFTGVVGQDLVRELIAQGQRARIKEQLDERPMCRYCFKSFPERSAPHFSLYRIARCEGCGWFTVRTKR